MLYLYFIFVFCIIVSIIRWYRYIKNDEQLGIIYYETQDTMKEIYISIIDYF